MSNTAGARASRSYDDGRTDVRERPLLSHRDLDDASAEELLGIVLDYGTRPEAYKGILEDRRIGLLFSAPSTRTRAAFWRAAMDLGADVISFGPGDLQLTTGETWDDTGRVLSEYLDAVVVRTNGPLEEMRALARSLPATVNALSKSEHPTQALADYCAMHEHFGGVDGIRLAYFGEGNNTAAALAFLMARIAGVRCDFYYPSGFGLDPSVVAAASEFGSRSGAIVRAFDGVPDRPDPVDVVYTTRWQAMGVARASAGWRSKFEPFRVDQDLFDRFTEPGRTVFMHDLPATRGEEVSDEILDGDCSIVQRQAHHKRTAAGAALLWCLGRAEPKLPLPRKQGGGGRSMKPSAPVRVTAKLPGPLSAAALARQAEVESNAHTYPRHLPVAVAEAAGSWVTDLDGNIFLDFLSGAGVLSLGHSHPEVLEAVRYQLGRGVHTLDLPTDAKAEFTSAVLDILPPHMRGDYKIHFCGPTGADAVEAGLKLCKSYTGRGGVIAFQGAYHGCTTGAMSVTGAVAPKERVIGLMPEVHFFPYGYCHRCPLGLDRGSCDTNCAPYLRRSLSDPSGGIVNPAAILMEVVQGEGGSIPAPVDFVRSVANTAKTRGIPLIVDEIQSGIGRTGRWFAFEQYGIEPDVILLSKALGGVGMPVSVILYRTALDGWFPGSHVGTFRGNNLAFAAGSAALRVIEREGLLSNARCEGEYLLETLADAARDLTIVDEVRGIGLMIGLELRDPADEGNSTALARRVQRHALERGLIIELGGRDDCVIRLLPPLNLTHAEARTGAEALIGALRAVDAEADKSRPYPTGSHSGGRA